MPARIPGEFVPLDVYYLRDPAIQRAGPDAELLYIRALAHAKAIPAGDGQITRFDLAAFSVGLKNVPARIAALVREQLWTETTDGWAIRSWSKWNRSAEEIEADKQRKREGALKTNHDRYHQDDRRPDCPLCQPEVLPIDRRAAR